MGKKNQTFGEIAETTKLQNLKPEQRENVSRFLFFSFLEQIYIWLRR
jgi:hypothetical protein